MRYFTNTPYTPAALKAEYRALCKRLHPDTGGSADAFKEMMSEYQSVMTSVGGTQQWSDDEDNGAFTQPTYDAFGKNEERTEESRYSLLCDLLTNGGRHRGSGISIDAYLSLFRRLARLPFSNARVRYYDNYRLLKVEMEFEGAVEELKVEYYGFDELSYTIYEPDSMYMSTDTIDVIIDKVIEKMKEN